MSLFDAFTGAPAKRAAEQNRALYGDYKREGLGYLDTGYQAGTGYLNQGVGAFDPLASLGQDYQQGANAYGDATGAHGMEGQNRAMQLFQNSPGYAAGLTGGLDQLDRRQASRGMLGSGNTNIDTIKFAGDYANQKFGQYQQALQPYLGAAGGAIQGAAQGQGQMYGGLAGLASNDAMNRTNVGGNFASGMSSANNMQGMAEMQGSKNAWDFAQNMATAWMGMGQPKK